MTTQHVLTGDSLELLKTLPDNSIDAVLTDPPYELGFMGKAWDNSGIAYSVPLWTEVLRVLKPGGHLAAFGATRTYHRLAVAIEDAGFEIRDSLHWTYGSGFPKSLDVSKAIDKRGGANIAWFGPWLREERKRRGIKQSDLAAHFPSKTGGKTGCVANWELGLNLPTVDQFNTLRRVLDLPFTEIAEAEREVIGTNPNVLRAAKHGGDIAFGAGSLNADVTAPGSPEAARWSGYGTALKPAHEPIVLARKPIQGTVAANILQWGTGALNIDASRVGTDLVESGRGGRSPLNTGSMSGGDLKASEARQFTAGRWPSNVLYSHDGGCVGECVPGCPVSLLDRQSGTSKSPAVGSLARKSQKADNGYRMNTRENEQPNGYGDNGGASRFFPVLPVDQAPPFAYIAKPSKAERNAGLPAGNTHVTVKPVAVMSWLATLLCPAGGVILDPFAGSGTTGVAAVLGEYGFVGIELDPGHVVLAEARIRHAQESPEAFLVARKTTARVVSTSGSPSLVPVQESLFGDEVA